MEKSKDKANNNRTIWIILGGLLLILFDAVYIMLAFSASPTTDVWAHYFPGIVVTTISVVTIFEATGWVKRAYTSIAIGLIFLAGGIYLSGVIFGHIELNPFVYGQVDATNFQHLLIYWSMILTGLLLIGTSWWNRVNLSIRAVWLMIAAYILFFHSQPHDFSEALQWLTPYHRTMAALLVASAISYFLLVFGFKKQWLLAVSGGCLLTVGIMLMAYHDPAGKTELCTTTNQVVVVKITQDGFDPNNIQARHCDVLRFEIDDQNKHVVAFGDYKNHQHYGRYTEATVEPDQVLDINLDAIGTFNLHDHLNPDAKATLFVAADNQ